MSFPSIVPGGRDLTVHIVEADFGRAGRAYVETDVENADLHEVTNRLISGEYDKPLRVVAFNTVDGWSRDISEDLARTIANQFSRRGEALPSHLLDFVESYLGLLVDA